MSKPPKVSGFSYVRSADGFSEYTLLKNGMRVLLGERHDAPVVGVMVTYHVGSRNEVTGTTGATHMLEHLLFDGSVNFNKKNGKTIWALLESKGAVLNATTYFDRTHYFAVCPNSLFETALAVEADRMRGALFTEKDRSEEMTIVRNEFERGENNPVEALDKAVWATAFAQHPYKHPTIGFRSDIESMRAPELRHFYDTFYWPNNATLTILGNVKVKDALVAASKYFEKIPRSPHPIPTLSAVEPPQEGEKRVFVERAGGSRFLCLAHKTPEGLHSDTPALHVLIKVLMGGRSSRLSRLLVDTGLTTALQALSPSLHDPGLSAFYAQLTPKASFARVEKIMADEIEKIAAKGITRTELQIAKKSAETESVFSKDGHTELLFVINESLALGDWGYFLSLPRKLEKVTSADVMHVARLYFTKKNRTVGLFEPTQLP